jgi:hypothetical protein
MAIDDSIVPHTLDDYFQSSSIGSVEQSIGNNLYGINHRQIPSMVPMNKDSYGLTFFVRPQLNFQSDNIRNYRLLYPLLTDNTISIQRFVRATLDPRLLYGYGQGKTKTPAIKCPIVDNTNAFIPVLTNNLNSISGWPDTVAPTFSSKEGLYGEVYSQVDGIVRNYGAFDIDATFRNTKGDPIVYMFYAWLHYMSMVYEGLMVPYPDFIIENEIDYNTRIYRLVLDSEKRYVTKIAATGVSFPVSIPLGQFFDFNKDKPYNDQSSDITIRFRCLGAQYQDDILVKEFNATVALFNPDMKDGKRDASMMKITTRIATEMNEPLMLFRLNNRGYPRISPNNYELEWWFYK